MLTYVDIVNRMIDLERLATFPAEGERCAQFSSYSRESRYDAATDRYIKWGASPEKTFPARKGTSSFSQRWTGLESSSTSGRSA